MLDSAHDFTAWTEMSANQSRPDDNHLVNMYFVSRITLPLEGPANQSVGKVALVLISRSISL